ncbi:hypothetical protein [Nitrosopumilus sp. b2]|uniref:hypothetical protein n=1 Tax=Nitrosopumilus sp. b2 TaxID=2109908 RepID=UPI0015F5FB4C|nr:hypothetical protein [Nitrosopumilus sp. b2]
MVGSFFTISTAYGIWLPQSPEELLEESQAIFVGIITSVNKLELEQPIHNEDFPLILDEYTVYVEESVKNTQIPETLTVRQPTVSTPGRLFPYEGFEIGDRVLFYVKSFDGTSTYSKESFLIPKQCDTFSVITKPRMIGSDYIMMQNGVEKQDNFTANSLMQFTAKRDMGTLSGASLEYDVFISKQVGGTYKNIVLNQTVTGKAQPCEWLSVAQWEFTPDTGNYLLNGRVYKVMSNFSISNQFFSVLAEPPLKQFKSGVPFSEIKCNGDLQLTQRYDDSPACVKSETVFELIKRGWVSNIIMAVQSRDVFLEQDATSSYMEKIVPTLDDFKHTLSDSYDINTIFSKFGEPHKDIGSGIHIYVYELNDNTEVWIGYVDDIWYVKHVDLNGNVLEELFEKNEYNTPDGLKGVFGNCACQERTKTNPDTMERCPQPEYSWENSTHYINNNICEWREK